MTSGCLGRAEWKLVIDAAEAWLIPITSRLSLIAEGVMGEIQPVEERLQGVG
jgi:hypothetical protein